MAEEWYDLERGSGSRAPSMARVHRDDDEHHSLGRVSKESAKRGWITELLYASLQEEALTIRGRNELRNACHAAESSPKGDHSQAVKNAALDEQALKLGGYHDPDLIDLNFSVEEDIS